MASVTLLSSASRGSSLNTPSSAKEQPQVVPASGTEAGIDTSAVNTLTAKLTATNVSAGGLDYEAIIETQPSTGAAWQVLASFFGSLPAGGPTVQERIISGLGVSTRCRWRFGAYQAAQSGTVAVTGETK